MVAATDGLSEIGDRAAQGRQPADLPDVWGRDRSLLLQVHGRALPGAAGRDVLGCTPRPGQIGARCSTL